MCVSPIWRKKLNSCNSSNEVNVNLPTPMSKLQTPLNEASQENPPTNHPNHVSLQSYSLRLSDPYDTNNEQSLTPPQSVYQTQLTQPPFPYLLLNPLVGSMLHAQPPTSPHGNDQAQPLPPQSPSREMLIDEINQLQDLSNLLAMHLSQLVTGTFSLNNQFATVLFDSRVDFSFISTKFAPLLNVEPCIVNPGYVIEIIDGKSVEVDRVIRDCKLELGNSLFTIDLIPLGYGSFDVIVGMDWLSKNKVVIVCHEKVVEIPIKEGGIL
ncbi:putative reverse transcriptase domain-containing protein [Tanacetum coccineum]